MSTMTRPPAPDAFTVVSHSLTEGWRRMVWLLFKGPHASARTWCTWGLVILVASELGLNLKLPAANGPAVIAFTVVFGLVLLYFSCRFQLLLLEGVLAGEPRIAAVWPRTAQPGLGFMLAQLVPTLALITIGIVVFAPLLPVIEELANTPNPEPAKLFAILLPPLLRLSPFLLALVLVQWFLKMITLPLLWLRPQGIGSALAGSLGLAFGRFGATVLLLLAQFVVGCVAAALVLGLFCCTFCVWLPPLGFLSVVTTATERFPILGIATVPLTLLVTAALGWVYSTLTAPVTLLFRAWSLAFVAGLDPSLGSAPPPVETVESHRLEDDADEAERPERPPDQADAGPDSSAP